MLATTPSRVALMVVLVALAGCTGAPPPAPTTTAQTEPGLTPRPTQTAAPAPPVAPATAPAATPTPGAGTPGSTASVVPSPAPPLEAWPSPELISTEGYSVVSLVVDGNGAVHAGADNWIVADLGSLFYLSNATGSWSAELLGRGEQTRRSVSQFSQPIIGLDRDGSVWMAFYHAEGDPEDMFWGQGGRWYLTTGGPADWSDAVELGPGDAPSIVVRDGVTYFAAQDPFAGDIRCDEYEFALTYRTNLGGDWTAERLADQGLNAQLALASDGTPRILFSGSDYYCAESSAGSGLRYATGSTPTGPFTFEDLPGTAYDEAIGLGLDARGRPHVVLYRGRGLGDEDFGDTWYTVRGDASWSEFERVFAGARAEAMAVDADGSVHVVGRGNEGAVYATNRGGSFQTTLIADALSPDMYSTMDLALGPDGRPHVLFTLNAESELHRVHELWYAVGPP